jgi:hypothetical protein
MPPKDHLWNRKCPKDAVVLQEQVHAHHYQQSGVETKYLFSSLWNDADVDIHVHTPKMIIIIMMINKFKKLHHCYYNSEIKTPNLCSLWV